MYGVGNRGFGVRNGSCAAPEKAEEVNTLTRAIVLASGKGGTGKTSVTAGIGCALAKLGYRCLMVDADAGMQSLDMALGVCAEAAFNFADVVRGDIPLADAAVPLETYPTASVLAAPMDMEFVQEHTLRVLVRNARDMDLYDYILIDAPAGIGRGFQMAARAAESALIVATADPICLRSAEKCAQELEKIGIDRSRLIVNRVRTDFIRRGLPNLDDAIDGAGIALAGYVPEDEAVMYCGASGTPVLMRPRRRASRAFLNIAKRITGENIPLMKIGRV